MNDELAPIKKSLRLIKAYALLMTALFIVIGFAGFTQSSPKQNFEEITASRIELVDSAGKVRVILGGDLKKANLDGMGRLMTP